MLDVTLIPILEDNYCYLIQSAGKTALVDPGESKVTIATLEKLNLSPDYIFITHHHWDHVNGVKAIKDKYGCQVIGPAYEADKIQHMDVTLSEDETFQFGDEIFTVIKTCGHTAGHIIYYAPQSKVLFSGDTLFSLGCGRLFEGTPEDMFESFQKIHPLPDETRIYCGHEYTQTNGNFCLTQEPDNQDLIDRMAEVEALRAADKPTIPTTLEQEKKTNVFLRAPDAVTFKKYRAARDEF